ncbi:MAG: DNA-processing protein DprA [Kiritimatiellae bacterium]|nr:DNA-processing protein DprA [Kiritimatiellia bacterium]
MTEREAYIALNLMGQIGPVRARSLAARLGSLAAIFEASERELCSADGIGPELAAHIVRRRGEVEPVREEEAARGLGARIVTPADAGYPEPLRTIHDPPLALYVVGEWTAADRHAIAVVGSRRCTHYGRSTADRLAAQLAGAGVTVVSGLARGIDMAAHEGALRGGGRTIAVLGGALDRLYPAEAGPLADRIAERGAVISEYPLGREPDRTTFPYRNRLISGLSMGVVIVEADRQSGAMITAAQALEQGRLVFAVPGRVDQPMSRGPHQLIRQGARLVEDARDVLEEFEYLFPPGATTTPTAEEPAPAAFAFSDEEARIVEVLSEGELDADSLARRAGLPPAKLGPLLVGLEIKRVVRMLPGRLVALTVKVRRKAQPE